VAEPWASRGAAAFADPERMEATSRALAAELVAAVGFSRCDPADMAPKSLVHDRFFHVSRVGPAAPARLLAALEAAATAAQLVRASDASDDLRTCLFGGLAIALGQATGRSVALPAVWPISGPRATLAPMERWVRGHHVFLVLVQAAAAAHRASSVAVLAGRPRVASAALTEAIALLAASGAAMQLTGEMRPEAYAEVRAAMTGEDMPPGFSGLWSADHQALLRAVAGVGKVHHALDAEELARWRAAIGDVYDHHAHVCDVCVEGEPSLRMRHRRAPSSATTSLETYRRRTLRLSGDRYRR
jgi:hypothetical protein